MTGSLGPATVNSLWLANAWPESRRFHAATRDPAAAQSGVLAAILRRNATTEYGRRHGFEGITSPAAYQDRVPVAQHDDLAADIHRMAAGKQGVLTAEAVTLFEPTGGSTAGTKLIPYTPSLSAEFQRGLAPWICDLFACQPDLLRGPAYWSVTPLTGEAQRTSAGIPIGFAADSAYLGPLGGLLAQILAVPNAVKRIQDLDAFRYTTLLFLLKCRALRLISVWNPTFLSLLLDPLPAWWDMLVADIAGGTLSPPAPIPSDLHAALSKRLRPDRTRSEALAELGCLSLSARLEAVWPHLGLISCWADGPAARALPVLKAVLPRVAIQGKGLLATEAFVSLPLHNVDGAVPALRSHFLEFMDVDGTPSLISDIVPGQSYEVMVTTGGGLYRYSLRDRVEVVGTYNATPCLRFLGKTDRVSDWFGEKLDEAFVAQVLDDVLARHGIHAQFVLLAPTERAGGIGYTLFLEPSLPESVSGPPGPAQSSVQAQSSLLAQSILGDLDESLGRNFHYAYCRRLGQLHDPELVLVQGGAQTFLDACRRRGQRLGNIKAPALDADLGWRERFAAGPQRAGIW